MVFSIKMPKFQLQFLHTNCPIIRIRVRSVGGNDYAVFIRKFHGESRSIGTNRKKLYKICDHTVLSHFFLMQLNANRTKCVNPLDSSLVF